MACWETLYVFRAFCLAGARVWVGFFLISFSGRHLLRIFLCISFFSPSYIPLSSFLSSSRCDSLSLFSFFPTDKKKRLGGLQKFYNIKRWLGEITKVGRMMIFEEEKD